jgi:hypothetical protein
VGLIALPSCYDLPCPFLFAVSPVDPMAIAIRAVILLAKGTSVVKPS